MNLIQVQRLDEFGVPKSKPLWLAWVGIEMPALSSFWQLYCRRFAIDHWYRFAKQRLHWTLPQLSTPRTVSEVERPFTIDDLATLALLMILSLTTQCQRQKKQSKLSPGRVAQAMGGVFAAIGTPSHPPKPRGKSPGWTAGKPRLRRIRYPIVRKNTIRQKKEQPKSA